MTTSVMTCGVVSDDDFRCCLADALGSSVHLVKVQPGLSLSGFAGLVLSMAQPGPESLCFALWARSSKLSTLIVKPGADEILLGPLTLPWRSGCDYCAYARTLAAAASLEPLNQETFTAEYVPEAVRVIATEVQAILQSDLASSNLLDHLLVCNLTSGKRSLHRVIPLPHCPVCGGAKHRPSATTSASLSSLQPPEVLIANLSGWLDARTGLISCIELELPEAGRDLPIIVTAAPPHLLLENGSFQRFPVGWGKGLCLSGALLSAVGEAIERYSASLPDPTRIRWKRCAEVSGEFLDPRSFPLYSPDQYEQEGFPFAPFDPDISHPWVLGHWADNAQPVWVPATSVFLSFQASPRHFYSQGTSNGLAAGADLQDASMRALLELLERDAFMSAWLTGIAGERVELDESLDPELRQLLEGVQALGASVELYVLPTCAWGTAILCLALGDGIHYPGVTIGLAADGNPLLALRQALLELAQTGPHLRRRMQAGRMTIPPTPQAVREMLDHAAYYFPQERVSAFDRLRSSRKVLPLKQLAENVPDCERSFTHCAADLGKAGIRVALVDVTSSDVLLSPFRVVRAVSPDLQPISYGYGHDFEPVQRLRQIGLVSGRPPIHPIW